MDHLIPAVFDSGIFRPLQPVELAQGTQVEVQIPAASDGNPAASQQATALTWSDFIERTYGSCAGLGLQRHEQGDLEAREPIA
ncbi:MAG: antitoxin family protein [Bythopirellula sp.]|nr:antitoxin family protein [Bythopirellula sp.]